MIKNVLVPGEDVGSEFFSNAKEIQKGAQELREREGVQSHFIIRDVLTGLAQMVKSKDSQLEI